MALMSRKVDYALLILAYLELNPSGCARAIAEQFGLSRAFVANILKELCHAGLVTGHRGVKGGYVLRRPADEVNLAELIEVLDGRARLNDPGLGPLSDKYATVHGCPIRGALAEVHERIRALLGDITLAEMLRPSMPDALQSRLDLRHCATGASDN